MPPTYILFSSYCSVAVLLLESKWDAYLKQFYKAEWHCKLQFNLDLVEWVMGTHFCFMLQPLLALQMYFWVQLYWWNLSIFLQADAICWLFVVISFGIHAVWISETSLILFLKLNLFLVIFVLYNCIFSDSGAHTVQLKCLLPEKKRLRSWLYWFKWSNLWNYIQPVDPYLGEAQQTWKMTFPREFFGSLELHHCMSQRQAESCVDSEGWQSHPCWGVPQLPVSLVISGTFFSVWQCTWSCNWIC